MRITIPGQTRPKKNMYRVRRVGGRTFISTSAEYDKWEEAALFRLKKEKVKPWDGSYPVEIKFFFFRESFRKWDVDNSYGGLMDLLQKAKIISDDSVNHVIPIFAGWSIDKKNPRVEILITEAKKDYFREDLQCNMKYVKKRKKKSKKRAKKPRKKALV